MSSTETKHTKGEMLAEGSTIYILDTDERGQVNRIWAHVDFAPNSGVTLTESRATARRLAIAWNCHADLLEALQFYLTAQPQCGCTDTRGCPMAAAREKARAAIAKAQLAPPRWGF